MKALATLSFRWWMIGAMAREEVATSTEILRHYIQMPYVNHLQRGPADLLRSTGDAVTVFYGGVVAGLIGLITESIGITAILAALLVTAPLPTVALFAYFGVAGYVYRRVTRARVARIGSEMTDLSVRTFEAAYTILSGIKAIKMRGNPDHYLAEYESARARAAQVQRTSTILGELPKHLLEMLFIVGIGLASVVIFSQQSSGQSLGLLALFVAAGFRILPGMARLMGALNAVTVGLPMSRIVVAEVAQARQDAQSIDPPALSSEVDPLPFNRQLALSGLTFRYPETPVDVLRGIDLTIDRGTSVALVGGSGAGKSTLVDVMLGLHTPREGTITVDGVNIQSHMASWQANLAMVPQDVYLLDRSLRENIALGVAPPDIDDDLVDSAVDHAQLKDLIAELPAGLSSRVGDRGARLSGGQRQRIGIARALYHQPNVLVLDEATSALDNLTERRIADTIQALAGDITVILVAHRLSTVRHCDQLVYMELGRVLATGTFDEVRRDSPGFDHLVRLGDLSAS